MLTAACCRRAPAVLLLAAILTFGVANLSFYFGLQLPPSQQPAGVAEVQNSTQTPAWSNPAVESALSRTSANASAGSIAVLSDVPSGEGHSLPGLRQRQVESLSDQVAQERRWPTLQEVLDTDSQQAVFAKLAESASQSWRIQAYGEVGIVTSFFAGLNPTSGIGTAAGSLAEMLAAHGFQVTVLYTGMPDPSTGTMEHWQEEWKASAVRLVPLPGTSVAYDAPDAVARSHRVYMWLKAQGQAFDVLHFIDTEGTGFFSIQAKAQGLAFRSTALVLHVHRPHLWNKLGSQEVVDELQDLMIDFMQRQTVANVDLVVSPTQYMLRWMHAHDWLLVDKRASATASVAVVPNLLPRWLRDAGDAERPHRPVPASSSSDTAPRVAEIVFASNLRLRKGIVSFCDALDQLLRDPDTRLLLQGMNVTILGKLPSLQQEPVHLKDGPVISVETYLRQRAKKWSQDLRFRLLAKDIAPQQRIDYLRAARRDQQRLAIIPSLVENSPYSVLEAFAAGVPFLASDTGGVHEWIKSREDADEVLVATESKAWSARLATALRKGGVDVPAWNRREWDDAERTWLVWHHLTSHRMRHVFDGRGSRLQFPQGQPLVSICMVHFDKPSLLKQALRSIDLLDYPNIEVLLVDDGSPSQAAQDYLEELELLFAAKGWQLFRQQNRGPGAGRNLAARHAKGEWLLFMDDDNVAKREEVSAFVSVGQRTGAEVLTVVSDQFLGDEYPAESQVPSGRWVPLGAATEVGILRNMFGDTNALVRADTFWQVGGFPEDWGYAKEDWELFSKCVLQGHKLVTIPDSLYWYRLRESSHSRLTQRFFNHGRTIRPYLRHYPPDLHHLLLLAQGFFSTAIEDGAGAIKSSMAMADSGGASSGSATAQLQQLLRSLAASVNVLCSEGQLSTSSSNLLVNGNMHFAASGATVAHGWHPHGRGYEHVRVGGRLSGGSLDRAAIRMSQDSWKQESGARQTIHLQQQAPDAVVLSGWSRAEGVGGSPDSGYSIYVDVVFADGDKMWGWSINFDTGTHDWQLRTAVLETGRAITSLQVYAMFRQHSGTVWFDDLSVMAMKDGLCDYAHVLSEQLKHIRQ